MLPRNLLRLAGLFFLLALTACHTTQIGQNIGFPSPQERARGDGAFNG